jgi:exodeoxyribonuclease VII small subunit
MNDLPQNRPEWNYEATVDRIEAIIDRVESGELPLEEVFQQFAIAAEAFWCGEKSKWNCRSNF